MKKYERPVEIFMGAILNELHRDTHVFKQYPVHIHTEVVIPRLEKLTFLAWKFPMALAIVANIVSKLWLVLFYPIFLLFQVIFAAFCFSRRRVADAKEVYFANSVISLICAKANSYEGKYIYATKRLERFGPVGESLGCISDYVTWADIASAFLNSVRSMFLIGKFSDVPGVALQVYPAFGWFLTWNVLNKIKGNLAAIWSSSDSDRWAILLDRLPTDAKKIIVQHGLLRDPVGYVGFRSNQSLPTRLTSIDEIILLDDESEVLYRNLVLAEGSNTKFVSENVWGHLLTQDKAAENRKSALIIGQMENLEAECRLANNLVNADPDVCIYLKPHPSFGAQRYLNLLDKNIELIGDPFFFPRVNLCICFGHSTLAHLYKKSGIQVVYMSELESDDTDHGEHFILSLMTSG